MRGDFRRINVPQVCPKFDSKLESEVAYVQAINAIIEWKMDWEGILTGNIFF